MKNCFDCKHSKTFALDFVDRFQLKEYQENPSAFVTLESKSPLVGIRYGKCLAGFNERMKQFRDEHGDKTREAIEDNRSLDMDCHDYSDGSKKLDEMIGLTQKMLDLLDAKNNTKNTDPI